MKNHLRRSGFTILEMLVAVAILGIVTAGFMSMMQYTRKELNFANRKVEAIELRRTASVYMADLGLCGCQLNANGGTFDATAAAGTIEMPVTKFQTSCDPAASTLIEENQPVPGSSSGLAIDTMKLYSIESIGTPERYRGRFRVEFRDDAGAYKNRGFELELQFNTDPATPDTAKKIVGCDFVSSVDGGGGAGGGGGFTAMCPEGQYMLGILAGEVVCSAVIVDGIISNQDPDLYSLDSPGPGCRGTACLTGDFGVCRGTSCITNGNRCVGTDCMACGPFPSCSGTSCNSRPGRCKRFERLFVTTTTTTTTTTLLGGSTTTTSTIP